MQHQAGDLLVELDRQVGSPTMSRLLVDDCAIIGTELAELQAQDFAIASEVDLPAFEFDERGLDGLPARQRPSAGTPLREQRTGAEEKQQGSDHTHG